MFHLFFGILLAGLIFVGVIASPAFRYFVFFIILVLGGGIWWAIDSSNRTAEKNKQERAAQEYLATTAIKLDELKFENVNLKKASYGDTGFLLEGIVTNNSAFTLGTIYLEVTLTDCQNENCHVVGQTNTSSMVKVPSGQVRAFTSYSIRFDNLPPVIGSRSWTYKITSLRTA
jgi:hypothetical protein